MMPLTNHHFQWRFSEVSIIDPYVCLYDLHDLPYAPVCRGCLPNRHYHFIHFVSFLFIEWVERQSQTTTSATSLSALVASMLYVQPHRLVVGRRCLGSCAPWGSGIPWRNACCSSAKGTGSTFWTGPSFLPQMRCVKSWAPESKSWQNLWDFAQVDHSWLICS